MAVSGFLISNGDALKVSRRLSHATKESSRRLMRCQQILDPLAQSNIVTAFGRDVFAPPLRVFDLNRLIENRPQ